MAAVVQVAIHPSQFPEAVRRELLRSLRTRQVNPKFHYESRKQAQKWLELHQAYSPSRTDPDCAGMYDRSFKAAASLVQGRRAHVIGLGCGGGIKDSRLLRLLRQKGAQPLYTPVDVSYALVLTARDAACKIIPARHCFPTICDLAAADDLAGALQQGGVRRLLTFFGMIPNFEPGAVMPRLARLLRPGDWLLFSANLAPGADYLEGVRRVLPGYDNALTREWLLMFLLDLGIAHNDGAIRFAVEEETRSGLARITAYFRFERRREIRIGSEDFEFSPGESMRLFFSYRYTVDVVREVLGRHRLDVLEEFVTRSGEEAVFLARRAARS